MEKSSKIVLLLSLFCISTTYICKADEKESFVIKKKKKRVSKSKLQQELCTTFANQLSSAPAVHKKIAEIQEVVLKETYKYIENAKDGCILASDKNKIDAILKVAQEFEQKVEQFCKDCEQYTAYLSKLS